MNALKFNIAVLLYTVRSYVKCKYYSYKYNIKNVIIKILLYIIK